MRPTQEVPMSQQVSKSGRWLFGLAILTALAFGARAALASTGASMSCPPDSIGTCVDQADCKAQCDAVSAPRHVNARVRHKPLLPLLVLRGRQRGPILSLRRGQATE